MQQPSVTVTQPLHELYTRIEAALRRRLASAVQYDWNEDFLSRSLCEILRDHSPFKFRTHDNQTAEVQIVFVKNTGKVETNRGDIGATVRITTKDDQTIVSCGYLEAKRRYHRSLSFDEIRWDQLNRIVSHVPHAMLLLYDFDDVRFNADVSGDALVGSQPNSRAVVLPISLALAMNTNTDALYLSSTPLAHQVCYRYLHGLDLEPVAHPAGSREFFAAHDLDPEYRLDIQVNHVGLEVASARVAAV